MVGRIRQEKEDLAQCEKQYGDAPSAPGLAPHLKQVPDSLRKAHSVHGRTHSIGKGEDEANGAPQLWAQTPGDKEVGAT